MILAEKFSQKLNNLKSKNEIADFFIFFDEFRSLYLKTTNGGIGSKHAPTHYKELSEGKYLIVWNNNKISTGSITTTSVSSFDDFISYVKKTAKPQRGDVFIPERGIYPMVRTYSKPLADIIDVPEYVLKLADILDEIDQMVGFKKGEGIIEVREGTRYAYSSRNQDENYTYTDFFLNKVFRNHFKWEFESSDIPSIMQFQELFSFLGDIYNYQSKSSITKIKNGKMNIILPPHIFKKLFFDQIISNIDGNNILSKRSAFSIDDFQTKKKVYGTLSISYDPLLNQKRGSYKFTPFGFKPIKQYFIKFGKLDTPILDSINYSQLGFKLPTVSIEDIGNIKFEGLKKKTFNDSRREDEKVIYIPDSLVLKRTKSDESSIVTAKSILFSGSKTNSIEKLSMKINLQELISGGQVELVEFVGGQLGIKIRDIDVKSI